MAKALHIKLTKAQIEALASLAELTLDRSGIEFGAWAEVNPKSVPALERALDRLNAALGLKTEINS